MEFSVIGKTNLKILATNFSPFFRLPCYSQVASLFYVHFRSDFCLTPFAQLPSLNRYEKVTCEKCGTQTAKLNLARDRKRCSVGTLYVGTLNFIFSPQNHKMIWITKLLRSTAPRNLMSLSSVNFVIKSFEDSTIYVSIETFKRECRSDQEQEMDVEQIVGDVENNSLREELCSRQHFLVDSEIERARHKVINYAMENLNAKIVDKKFDQLFKNLKC